LEIKCPGHWSHFHACHGRVPKYYQAQLQHQLLVSGAEKVHYFSYRPEPDLSPQEQWALIEVEPDLDYIEALLEHERAFWEELQARRQRMTDLTQAQEVPVPAPVLKVRKRKEKVPKRKKKE
jgi:predicted phage-related endonuclease